MQYWVARGWQAERTSEKQGGFQVGGWVQSCAITSNSASILPTR